MSTKTLQLQALWGISLLIIGIILFNTPGVLSLDLFLEGAIQTLWNEKVLVLITVLVTETASPVPLASLSVLLFLLFAKEKHWQSLFIYAFAGLFTWSVIHFLKTGLQVPRPETLLIHVETFRFPSGHAGGSTFLALTAYKLLTLTRENVPRIIVLLLILYPILVSATRIISNVHRVVDVVVGAGIALTIVPLLDLLLSKIGSRQHNRRAGS